MHMTAIAPDDLLMFLESVPNASIASVRGIISLRCAVGEPWPMQTYRVLQSIFADHESGRLIGSVDTAG